MRKGPWGPQPKQPDVPQKGADEVKKEEAKENGADKLEGKGDEEKKDGGEGAGVPELDKPKDESKSLA